MISQESTVLLTSGLDDGEWGGVYHFPSRLRAVVSSPKGVSRKRFWGISYAILCHVTPV